MEELLIVLATGIPSFAAGWLLRPFTRRKAIRPRKDVAALVRYQEMKRGGKDGR